MEIIVDCSVSTVWFMPDETSFSAEKLLIEITTGDDVKMIQPSLWLYETVNCLRTAVLRKRMSASDARNALFHIHELPVEYISPVVQGEFNIFEKAITHNLTAYDAAYLNLAEKRALDLYTGDRDLLKLTGEYPFIKDIREFKTLGILYRKRSRQA